MMKQKKSKSNKSKKKKKSNNNTTITTNNKKRKRKSSDSSGNNNVGEDVVHYDVEEDGDGNKTTKPILFREDSFDYFSFQQYKDSDFNKKEECDIIGGAKDDWDRRCVAARPKRKKIEMAPKDTSLLSIKI